MNENYDYDIVIVDSGVCFNKKSDTKELPDFYNVTEDFTFYKSTDYKDDIGHGSMIYHIITHETVDAKICVIRIFDKDTDDVDDTALISVLSFIRDNISCRIINLSLGLTSSDRLVHLEKVCREISDKDTVIVSAFDNNGSFSFPAAFDFVIGVDNWYQSKSVDNFEYVSDSPINIRAKGGLQKIDWNGRCAVIGGSSFACAHITAYIFNMMCSKHRQLSFNETLALLKENACNVYPGQLSYINPEIPFSLKKAAIFPFNKEMHQLVRFTKDLSFEITDVYDLPQTGRVGVKTSRIVRESESDASEEYVIKNIKRISYEMFDTLILGHLDELNRIAGYDIRDKITKEALEAGKNVYSFDDIDISLKEKYIRQFYHPDINAECTANNFGKLYQINVPVIGVWGTSSAQGKFTLQIILRKLFSEAGYSVGGIGSEPHSLLFGMDYVFPMGYASPLNLDDWQAVSILNKMVFSLNQKDVIIAGSQANSIPMNMYNLSSIPVRMFSYLLGINPDVVILNINPDDDIDYIRNTVKYIEGVADCKVLALVMFPMKCVNDWRKSFDIKETVSDNEFSDTSEYLREKIGLPVFRLGNSEHMRLLYNLITDYLT